MSNRSRIKVRFLRMVEEETEINSMVWDQEDMLNCVREKYPSAIRITKIIPEYMIEQEVEP